jgi:crotonobetainyl-CoA:carnitine CoA-transferase CaiB-like acyl-CoA transferase
LIEDLRKRGIPASEVANPCRLYANNPQFKSRGYFERPQHPIVGPLPLPSLPFRYASIERWLQKPAPTLGQHNQAVLGNLLGLSSAELAELETEGVIGSRPQGL